MEQETLFSTDMTPAECWEKETTKRALDELFVLVRQYKTSKSYSELIQFITHFHFYSPYNAMLVHIQMPGATFIAPARRWLNEFGRIVKTDARPLVILQPMGPVMFVFDVTQTEPGPKSRPLPQEVEKPFKVRYGTIGGEIDQTIENAKRDGIRIMTQEQGSLSAGSIRKVDLQTQSLKFYTGKGKDGNPLYNYIPVNYDLLISSNIERESQYSTLVHELAHLYCGHLGTPNNKWWPDRRGLSTLTGEFEAESVTYLVCKRLDIDIPSDEYLSSYLDKDQDIPNISLECLMKATGLIEQMGKHQLKARKTT